MQENLDKKRSAAGSFTAIVGIIVNVFLAAGKMAVGLLFGFVSVLADGLNNLTDCGSSAVSLLSFKLSAKPADKEHPFGHERTEYVCSLIVAFVILLVAFETVKEAFGKILGDSATEFSVWAVAVLGASILAKCALYLYYSRVAKKINSTILRASAVDSLSDCISTSVVLVCLCIGKWTGVQLDGYAGVLVSLFIAWAGIGVLKETFSNLIGRSPEEETLAEIKARVLKHEGVLGVHDLSVYCYGPNKYFASVHVEVDANVDVLTSHELVDEIEREFALETNIILTGHLDPIVTDDERVNGLKFRVETFIRSLDERFTVHDFRMVFGERRTNVLFDVAVPFDSAFAKEDLRERVENFVREQDGCFCPIVTVEHTV